MSSRLKKQDHSDRRVQKIMLAGLLMLIVAAYLVVYGPAASARASALGLAQTTQTQLEESLDRAAALDAVRAEVVRLERKLKRYRPLSKPQDLPTFHAQLSTLDDQVRVRKYNFQPGHAIVSNGYREWPAQITFEADFQSTMAFLQKLEAIDRLTRVRSFKIDTVDSNDHLLSVRISLSLFSSES